MGTPQGPPLLYKSSNVSNVNTNTNINTKNITKQGQLINQRSISIYAYKSILFEILQNDHISKVTLFYDQTQPSPPSYILFHTLCLFFFVCLWCVAVSTNGTFVSQKVRQTEIRPTQQNSIKTQKYTKKKCKNK